MDKLLTTEEVADVLGLSADRVRKLVQAKKLAYVRLGGTRWPLRFRSRAVEAFIASREVQPVRQVPEPLTRIRKQSA